MLFKMKFNPWKFRKLEEKVKQSIPKMLDQVASKSIEEFVKNITDEGFFGVRWIDNRRKSHILLKSGTLRSSIRVLKKGQNRRMVGSNLPYASVHNFGGTIQRSGYSIKMPQRKFIGDSPLLNRKLNFIIMSNLKKAIKLA